ncbi:hypothetical protein BKA59DRAFT_14326 [Fusarium tricinctum]|uniref:Uncharacterized protein n=1 Tax=Fusarium tricinctum TaxID=61284 RepID=A0A8K0WGJ2_9HYPO|nr:hypothetical protein BKA59DRAFT_14326 [Fusarium tricinctum]
MSNTEGQYFINPSEVYCRWRVAEDAICGSSGKFSSESALRNHYLKCHKITLEPRRPGQLDNKTKNDMIRWYASLGGNIQHNWAPRKARDRGKSPDSGPSPSLLSLHYSGVPTPLYGPGVRPSMPVDDEMTIKSPSHDQAPRRQANVPNDPAPPGPSLPEGN